MICSLASRLDCCAVLSRFSHVWFFGTPWIVHGILHARILEWVAMPSASRSSVLADSVQPHRRQPTRLPRPWDSPGKDTGVGCHFLLQCMKVKSESEVAQSCLSSKPHGLQPTRLLRPWSSPGKSTGVGCHCLLWLITLGYHKTLNHSTFSHYLFIVDVSVSNTYNTYNVLFKTILMVLTGNSSFKQMM